VNCFNRGEKFKVFVSNVIRRAFDAVKSLICGEKPNCEGKLLNMLTSNQSIIFGNIKNRALNCMIFFFVRSILFLQLPTQRFHQSISARSIFSTFQFIGNPIIDTKDDSHAGI
jgi:hypothetical protein